MQALKKYLVDLTKKLNKSTARLEQIEQGFKNQTPDNKAAWNEIKYALGLLVESISLLLVPPLVGLIGLAFWIKFS